MQKKSLIPNTKFLILSYPFNRWYNDLVHHFLNGEKILTVGLLGLNIITKKKN